MIKVPCHCEERSNPKLKVKELKNRKDKLRFYDPQSGKQYDTRLLEQIKFNFPKGELKVVPKLLRVDDKELNYDILNKISKPKKNDKN